MNLYAPFSPNDTAHHLVRPTAAFAKVDIPSDASDVFVGTPDSTFKVPMEEYYTDNLLLEGEESTTSSSQSLSSTGCGL